MSTPLKVTTLICTLSPSPSHSSSELLASEVIEEMKRLTDIEHESFRVVDYAVKFGVETDMKNGDAWPIIRKSILEADILLLATPIWMGQPSAVAKMVLERLDAELSETDSEGRPSMYGKVAAVAVVGNEDGAHHTSAAIFQSLCDVGFTIPAGGPTYWVGEAMGRTDYQDLDHKPQKTAETTKTLAANSVHLATLLHQQPYPA